jgi:hypothetical protein
VARKIKITNDFRAQKRDYVGANRKLKAGKNFFCTGRAAEHVAAFQHENFLARARQISGIDQPVVASAYDNHIVFRVAHIFIQPPC